MISLLMLAWFPTVVYLFTRFPHQRALIISFVAGFLFLPLAEFKVSALPDYNKVSATGFAVLLATALYDFSRFRKFRFHWFDLPILIWCLCPMATSVVNGLGPYDGFSSVMTQTIIWGVPYYLGRIYLNDFAGLRQLATGIFIGGLVYIPFCLFEVVARINLHGLIYRFMVIQQTTMLSIRYGGYRPSVFLTSGLMLGTWMMFATFMGIVLWRTKTIKQLRGISIRWWVIALLITFILVKATGAYALLVFAMIILLTAQWYETSFLLWFLLGGMFIYLYLGVIGEFPGQQIIDFLQQFIDPERLQSLGFRFMNEEILSAKARQQILFGWGGFGRNQLYDAQGYVTTTADSLWIIALGQNGLVGLISLFAALLFPSMAFWFFYPSTSWSNANVVIAAAIAVGLVMYALDCVLNAMVNPIYTLACGGLTGVVLNQRIRGVSVKQVPNY